MFLHRLTILVVASILILSLAACVAVGPAPSVTPTSAVGLLPTVLPATAQPESTLSALESPLAASTPVVQAPADTPNPGQASIAGRLIDFNTGQPMVNQNLSLPSVVCPQDVAEEDKREQCVYVIDDAFDPSVLTDSDGRFVFSDIAAGDYVLLVGSRLTKYTVLANESNQPIIWKVDVEQILELGDLVVELR